MVAMKSVFLSIGYLLVICTALPSSSKHGATSQSLIQADSLERTAVHESSNTESSSESVAKSAPSTLSPRITNFYQSYYEEKEKLTDVPLWNLLPLVYPVRNDTFANSIKAVMPKDTTLSNSGQVVFTFDISSIAKMEHVELMGAEFRIRSQLSNSSTTRTHDRLDQFKLNMFEILKDANTQRQKAVLHTSQQLTTAPDADNVFTVTSIVRDWLSGKSPSYSLSVELDSETGEDHSVFLEDTPILVLYMNKEREWKDRDGLLKHEEKKRLRRQTQFSPPEATGPHNSILPCSLKSVSIHIKDLRLSTSIIAPTKIRINYCSGHCIYPFTSTPASNSAHLQGRVAALSTHEPSIPMPCCAPKDFHPNIYLLKDEEDGTLSARVQQNEKVASCECR